MSETPPVPVKVLGADLYLTPSPDVPIRRLHSVSDVCETCGKASTCQDAVKSQSFPEYLGSIFDMLRHYLQPSYILQCVGLSHPK